jgi:hypothetical protein
MPLVWALVCGALALPGYLAGDPGFLPFLFTLIGGWLCGLSFVNATLRMPARRGLIMHIAGAVGAGCCCGSWPRPSRAAGAQAEPCARSSPCCRWRPCRPPAGYGSR